MNKYHTPVLVNEILELLAVSKGKRIIDATLGGGGHTKEFLKKGAIVLGIDQDSNAIEFVKKQLEGENQGKLTVVKGNFKDMKTIIHKNNFTDCDAILFDLGVSSYQINTPDRGFSFQSDSLLDMRMNKETDLTAFDVVNNYSKDELIRVIRRFGEEHFAAGIVDEIMKARKKTVIKTTKELSGIINKVHGNYKGTTRNNPATKTFQAIRIEVNSELDVLKKGLKDAIDFLPSKGRLGVISYHSLEDRITKLSLQDNRLKEITRKPVVPSEEEMSNNPRSRSAKLRVSEKL